MDKIEKEIKVAKKIFIKQAGHDESWLQKIIYNDPSKLGLGELILISREKKQSSGGRLDLLLEDPQDKSRYEIELMLGATDPSHIFRSIEYWDIEKRKYPNRQHYSVLIAETFERRYFNVVQILSLNIPMIAIQVDLLEVEGIEPILNFTKILDIYEEREEDEAVETASEPYWKKKASWTLEAANELLALLLPYDDKLSLVYTKYYIRLSKNNKGIYLFYYKAKPKSSLSFKEKDEDKVSQIKLFLDENNISFTIDKYKNIIFTVDNNLIKKEKNLFINIHKLIIKKDELNEPNENQN